MGIEGHATSEGTRRYEQRFANTCAKGHFREANDWRLSSIGLGTYLGKADDETDQQVSQAAVRSVHGGINLLDCAINYRFERAERSLAAAIGKLVSDGDVGRDELMVCTKGGFVPVPGIAADWFEDEFVKRRGLSPDDLVADCHCMHPVYLADQIDRSLANLDLGCIDVYYLHNPETQLPLIGPELFYERLSEAFAALEGARAAGKIGAYGLATWNGLRAGPEEPEHMDLLRAKQLAGAAAPDGKDGFRFIQLPLNLAMPEALLATQPIEGGALPSLEVARQLDIAVTTSASICQGRLVGELPTGLAAVLGEALTTDGQRALQFTRSTPGVTCALVGMKDPNHVEQNLALATMPPLPANIYLKLLNPDG